MFWVIIETSFDVRCWCRWGSQEAWGGWSRGSEVREGFRCPELQGPCTTHPTRSSVLSFICWNFIWSGWCDYNASKRLLPTAATVAGRNCHAAAIATATARLLLLSRLLLLLLMLLRWRRPPPSPSPQWLLWRVRRLLRRPLQLQVLPILYSSDSD